MEGEVKKGQKVGEWKLYYENGNIKSIGVYENSKKEGVWRYFYEDGTYKAMATFKNDEGEYKEYYPSGNLKSEGRILNGQSNGLWKYYYEEGQLKAEGEERNGLKEGHWKYYYPNGKPASEGSYVQGKEVGTWKYYHENGNVSAEGDTKEGQKDGYWKLYYKDGTFKGEGNFKEGDGPYKEYYESGKLKIEGDVKKGKNDGDWKYYYESGSLEGKCYFTDGKGHYTGYYENGNAKMEGMIEDGNKVGIWKLYNEKGQLAGYYKTYYENEVPVFQKVEDVPKDTLKADSTKPTDKVSKHLPKKRSRHYVAKVNEYKDFIVNVQPFGLLRNQLTASLEYYFQERLGFEAGLTLHRNPFFKTFNNLPNNAVFRKGYGAFIRQKLYQKDKDNGMFYWAQELRFTSIDYYVNTSDSTGASLWHSRENLYEFSFLFGDRLLRDARKKGWSIDIFGGLGIGYRDITRNYNRDPEKDALFIGLKTRSLTLPLRFGISIGYLF